MEPMVSKMIMRPLILLKLYGISLVEVMMMRDLLVMLLLMGSISTLNKIDKLVILLWERL